MDAKSSDCRNSGWVTSFGGALGFDCEVIVSSDGRRDSTLENACEVSAVMSRDGGGVPDVEAPAFRSVACADAANARTFNLYQPRPRQTSFPEVFLAYLWERCALHDLFDTFHEPTEISSGNLGVPY